MRGIDIKIADWIFSQEEQMNTNLNVLTEIKGWNTYHTRSVLTHVLMPEGFAIGLGLKHHGTGQVLREALIGRFGEQDEKITPGIRSYDGTYTELKVNYYDTITEVESAVIDGDQYLLVTPRKQGIRPMTLLISGALLWGKEGYVTEKDAAMEVVLTNRKLTVWTDGEAVIERNTGLSSPYLSVLLDRPVMIGTGRRMIYPELREYLDTVRDKVGTEEEHFGKLSQAYRAMKTCMAWDTIYEPEKGQLCTPVSRLWNINWGGYILFCWDTYFSSMMAAVENKQLAYSNIIAITREKTENDFIPNFGAAGDVKSRDRSQPPVGSLALKELYRIYREKELVEELFNDLLNWNRWFAVHRMLPNGQLCWGSEPYEPVSGNYWETHHVNTTVGGALESGLDNSPMYDGILFDEERHIMKLSDVGLTGLYLMDCENLLELAAIIDREEVRTELNERIELVKDGLSQMWDVEFGMFCNIHTDTGSFSHRISPTNFYALFSDCVTEEQAERMMQEHFYNPKEFYGEYILPSIARNDPAYPDQDYWRGRIWASMNFLVYLALRKQSRMKECKDLADKSLKLLMKEWQEHGHVHENYNCNTGEGCDVPNSDKFYHWGGLLSMIALMEEGYITGPEEKLKY